MKRSVFLVFTLIFALLIGCVPAYAAPAPEYELITEDTNWLTLPDQGATCKVEWIDGNAVFSGSTSGNWPSVTAKYGAEKAIKVKIEDYSLVYDFTVEGGNTNITFYFSEADHSFPLSNTSLGEPAVDEGSGDLLPAVYTGKVSLTDFVNSTSFLGNQMFDLSLISENNELTFHGVQVFSVSGGVITVRELKLVPNEGAEIDDEDESKTESEAESKGEASKPANSEQQSSASVDESIEDDGNGLDSGMIIVIVLACIALVAIVAAVTIVIIVSKKKKQ